MTENFFEGFEMRAVCPECGGLDAGQDDDGNVLCYCCGFIAADKRR